MNFMTVLRAHLAIALVPALIGVSPATAAPPHASSPAVGVASAPAASDFSLPNPVAVASSPASTALTPLPLLPPVVPPPVPPAVPADGQRLEPPPLPPVGMVRPPSSPARVGVRLLPGRMPGVDEVLPSGLLRAWQSLTAAMAAGDEAAIASFARPFAISVNRHERAGAQREFGRDINLPFAKLGFSPDIVTVRKDGDDAWLIRTTTTACWFRKAGDGWVLERYLDKPIE